MTNEEILTTLKAVRGLFANNSPFYIRKLGAPITNGDQSRIDAVFIAVDAAIASEGAAVSAHPQPDFRQVVIEILSNCAARYANPDRANWLDPQSVIDKQIDNGVEILAQFFAAAPAQEPRQDLYVISSTGDGAQTIIVPESKLKQSVHDTYCACGLEWPKCADEVIAETVAKVDDEEEWTREYPAYKRHVWSDHGEDYTVTIMRVTAAQEQPVENSITGWEERHDEQRHTCQKVSTHSPQKGKP